MRRALFLVLVGLALVSAGCVALPDASPSSANATVESVTDGDTVDVRFPDGSTDTVRLLGVDTPEVHVPVQPAEFGVPNTTAGRSCLGAVGENASEFTASLVANQSVRLEFDPMADRRGGYDRLLASVYRGEDHLNYRLVREGYARVYETEFTERQRFEEAVEAARSEDRGVWRCGG